MPDHPCQSSNVVGATDVVGATLGVEVGDVQALSNAARLSLAVRRANARRSSCRPGREDIVLRNGER